MSVSLCGWDWIRAAGYPRPELEADLVGDEVGMIPEVLPARGLVRGSGGMSVTDLKLLIFQVSDSRGRVS